MYELNSLQHLDSRHAHCANKPHRAGPSRCAMWGESLDHMDAETVV